MIGKRDRLTTTVTPLTAVYRVLSHYLHIDLATVTFGSAILSTHDPKANLEYRNWLVLKAYGCDVSCDKLLLLPKFM